MHRIIITLAALVALTLPAYAQGKPAPQDGEPKHRLVIHVDDNDPQKMNLALNNAANVSSHYAGKGEEVAIEIVAYGPGLHMLIASSSPVAARITSSRKACQTLPFPPAETP